jgi:hypothetical protein
MSGNKTMPDRPVDTSGEIKIELTDEELRRVAGGDQKTEPRPAAR